MKRNKWQSCVGICTSINPGPLACPSASTFVGSVPASVNGSQVYIPCLTWNTYPAGSMSSGTPSYFTPTAGANMTITFCSTIGSDCTPYSGMASGSRTFPTLSNVPPNALVFYVTTTGTTSPLCGNVTSGPSNCGIGVNGYIEPFSGSGGGVLGKMAAQSSYTGSSTMQSGVANLIVSSSGTSTGTYLFGGFTPSATTYTSGGLTYINYPMGLAMYSSTQY